jgi:uncharacterized protein YkwD
MKSARYFTVLFAALSVLPPSYGQSVEEKESESLETDLALVDEANPADAASIAQLIVEKTNEFRVAHGREKVEINPALTEAAEYFASYMAQHDVYGHTADGARPAERATKHGYVFCLVSENIAYQYSSAGFTAAKLAERFTTGWKDSPGHRKNMLDRDVVETGVAVAQSRKTGVWYAVQMFGRPASAALTFKISNRANTAIEYTIGNRTFELPPRYTRTHTRCRPSQVAFAVTDGRTKKVDANDGEHYLVAEDNGRLEIREE